MANSLTIRDIAKSEYKTLGALTVAVYSELEGFPSEADQPEYYKKLSEIGFLSEQPHTRVLVAEHSEKGIVGGVVYYSDMSMYGSGGTATKELNGSGIRLLSVDPKSRGLGAGKALTKECIELAKASGSSQVILHTTQAMELAWAMYEKLGFVRSKYLDFYQQELAVFGFRLRLAND